MMAPAVLHFLGVKTDGMAVSALSYSSVKTLVLPRFKISWRTSMRSCQHIDPDEAITKGVGSTGLYPVILSCSDNPCIQ